MAPITISLILYFGGKWLVRVTGADKPPYKCVRCRLTDTPIGGAQFCCEWAGDQFATAFPQKKVLPVKAKSRQLVR